MIDAYYEAAAGRWTADRRSRLRLQIDGSRRRRASDHGDTEASGHLDRTHRVRPSACTIDGREVTVPRARRSGTAAKDAGIDIPVLCHDERYDPVGVCRMCVVDVGARVLRRRLRAPVRGRHGGQDRDARARAQPRAAHRAAARRPAAGRGGPQGDDDRRQRAARARAPLRRRAGRGALPAGRGRGEDHSNPVISRQPRRLHPLRPLRARLRRHPGQRRHRPLGQGLRDADRVRPQRPDGRVVVRDLRRVRRRLPDRRARPTSRSAASRSARARSCARSTRSARTAASAAR